MTCYKCHSKQIDGCLKNKNLTQRDCGHPSRNAEWSCFYSVTYDTTTDTIIVRSDCIDVPHEEHSMKVFSICKSPNDKLIIKECRVCDSYLCNPAALPNISHVTLAFVPFAFLITKSFFH
ncbi:hypothetical protein RI129_010441 [Pyrocoelia pectoralis]|uniref:Uncharacterized protein n=1 Tax=Pyrocoelia pectoralis TaxID=417401 RepID=A0AAN7VDF7_9COLE